MRFSLNLEKQIKIIHALSTLALRANNKINLSFCYNIDEKDSEKKDSEEIQAQNLLRYYLIALGTKKVEEVRYLNISSKQRGLTYLKGKETIKRKSFYAFKTMLNLLQDSKVIKYTQASGLHVLTLSDKNNNKVDVVWVQGKGSVELDKANKVLDLYGNKLKGDIKITSSPIYAYH